VDPELARVITDALVAEVRRRVAPAVVIGSEDVRNLVGFQTQKRRLGCQDLTCLAEIGGAMGADRLVVGTLAKLGSTYQLDLQLIDDRKAQVVAEATERVRGKEQDALFDVVVRLTAQLFPPRPPLAAAATDASPAPPAPQAAVQAPVESPPGHLRPLTIGLGAGAIVGLGLAAIGLAEFLSFTRYTSPPAGRVVLDPQSQVNQANLWGTLSIAGAVVAVGSGTGAVLAW
jgi:hypothetical protein